MAAVVEDAIRRIRQERYGRLVSHPGWLYAAQIDHRFIDGRFRPLPIQRRPPSTFCRAESPDPDQAASEHLARLSRLSQPAELFAALDELARLDTPALTQDSFPDSGQALAELSAGDALNVIIVGAGPIGLALASAIKLALDDKVKVLVLEHRLSAPHRKLPYERRWITAVSHTVLDGIVEDGLSAIFKIIGNDAYIGAPINVLESLLLLSCRRLGVRFLFAEGFDLSTIRDLPVAVVFDATGNRLRPLPMPATPDQIVVVDLLSPDRLCLDVPAVIGFGVKVYPPAHDRIVTVGHHQGLFIPICRNQVLKQAMLKVIHIPSRLYDPLLRAIQEHNADNKFFLWPGVLHPAINELLLIINLELSEYEQLCKDHIFPLSLSEAVELPAFRSSVDARTVAILELLARQPEHGQMGLDAPFLYKPYLVEPPAPEQLHGKPCLRVGDSIYNGNVKMANGLGPHLQHIRTIQEALWQSAAARRAEQIGRLMSVVQR